MTRLIGANFRAKRFAGDYADVGEEVQISNFIKQV
jgi:hypothetical protein